MFGDLLTVDMRNWLVLDLQAILTCKESSFTQKLDKNITNEL